MIDDTQIVPLINAVRANAEIWNPENINYIEPEGRYAAWVRIGQSIHADFNQMTFTQQYNCLQELTGKWNHLYKQYIRYLKLKTRNGITLDAEPIFLYKNEMSFLRELVTKQFGGNNTELQTKANYEADKPTSLLQDEVNNEVDMPISLTEQSSRLRRKPLKLNSSTVCLENVVPISKNETSSYQTQFKKHVIAESKCLRKEKPDENTELNHNLPLTQNKGSAAVENQISTNNKSDEIPTPSSLNATDNKRPASLIRQSLRPRQKSLKLDSSFCRENGVPMLKNHDSPYVTRSKKHVIAKSKWLCKEKINEKTEFNHNLSLARDGESSAVESQISINRNSKEVAASFSFRPTGNKISSSTWQSFSSNSSEQNKSDNVVSKTLQYVRIPKLPLIPRAAVRENADEDDILFFRSLRTWTKYFNDDEKIQFRLEVMRAAQHIRAARLQNENYVILSRTLL